MIGTTMMLGIVLLLMVGLGLGLLVVYLQNQKSGPGDVAQNSYAAKQLMTDNEKEFYSRLVEALPNHYVFAQVALGALLQPSVESDTRKRLGIRGTFSQKIADYVVCTSDMAVVAIVELDDKTHSPEKDSKRDAMLNQAGYKVIRWESKKKPAVSEIAKTLALLA